MAGRRGRPARPPGGAARGLWPALRVRPDGGLRSGLRLWTAGGGQLGTGRRGDGARRLRPLAGHDGNGPGRPRPLARRHGHGPYWPAPGRRRAPGPGPRRPLAGRPRRGRSWAARYTAAGRASAGRAARGPGGWPGPAGRVLPGQPAQRAAGRPAAGRPAARWNPAERNPAGPCTRPGRFPAGSQGGRSAAPPRSADRSELRPAQRAWPA